MFEIELFICIKMDLALNNQQRLICHKPKQANKHTIICPRKTDAKIHWIFEIQRDHAIPAKRLYLVLTNTKTKLSSCELCCSSGQHREIERNWKNRQIQGRNLKKLWNIKVKLIPNVISCIWNASQGLEKEMGKIGN